MTAASIRDAAEREALLRALDASGWNVAAAARALGISRRTAYHWLQRFGLATQVAERRLSVHWLRTRDSDVTGGKAVQSPAHEQVSLGDHDSDVIAPEDEFG